MFVVAQIDSRVDIKYIFCDLDGTLLNEEKEISMVTVELLQNLKQKKKVRLGIATGRTLPFVMRILKEKQLLTLFDVIVANNGVEIFDINKQEINYLHQISTSTISTIINTFKKEEKLTIAFRNQKGFFASKRTEVIEDILMENGIECCFSPFEEKYEETARVMLIFDAKDKDRIVPIIKKQKIKKVRGLQSMNDTYEFVHEDICKANGLQYYLKNKRDSLLNVMCFGDSENDEEMLQHCGIGVAMKNATENCKDKASFICEFNNEEDGIYHFLRRYENYIWEVC